MAPLLTVLLVLGSGLGVQQCNALAISSAERNKAMPSTPVGQVVELLKGLSVKIELEGKEEEKLYYNFVCWAKSIIDQKTKSNADANARIDYLTTYIADIEAGRIEFTSERVDLEKEISTLMEDMETATAIREKEAADYETAADEMNKAIKALTAALDVLEKTTKDHKEGVMLSSLKVHLGSQTSLAAEAAVMTRAVQLGDRYLTKGDAFFLRKLLTGEVPTWDWKKLNRKATFKMSYKARSFKIQDVLSKLLETFSTNLADATAKEKEAKDMFDKLMDSKGQELDAARTALLKMEKESGASGLSKADAQTELDELKDQVAEDTKYIAEVKAALAKKKTEWQTRYTLRTEELSAISKAIAILHNDDARDLFKKSFASQGYSLLQERMTTENIRKHAEKVLKDMIEKSKDKRVDKIVNQLTASPAPSAYQAAGLGAGTQFDDVITAIDNMVVVLKGEEADDLRIKEACEKDRMDDTREAVLAGRAIDDFTETIVRLRGEIKELTAEIAKNTEEHAQLVEDLADAKKIRDEEHAEYLKDKADDVEAKATVLNAQSVLQNFYSSNNLMLVQKKNGQPKDQAGKAPPPPPKTWNAPYGGATGESTGIIAILGMVAEDIQGDMDKAKADDDDSETDYQNTKTRLETEKTEKETLNTTLTGTKTTKEGEVTTAKSQRKIKKGALDSTMQKIEGAEPACNYFTINYVVRARDRQIEIDGLLKAKAILQGGKFDAPDPNREIKPGDALVQKSKRGKKPLA